MYTLLVKPEIAALPCRLFFFSLNSISDNNNSKSKNDNNKNNIKQFSTYFHIIKISL